MLDSKGCVQPLPKLLDQPQAMLPQSCPLCPQYNYCTASRDCKKYIHLQLRHHSSQSTRVEIRGNPVKSCIVPNWMACGPSYTFNVQLCAWLPRTDCAPQMHFVFLFSRFLATCALAVLSSSQGLSLLSQPPCTLISLSALLFLPPLLQPGQHCTSFQSLYF